MIEVSILDVAISIAKKHYGIKLLDCDNFNKNTLLIWDLSIMIREWIDKNPKRAEKMFNQKESDQLRYYYRQKMKMF